MTILDEEGRERPLAIGDLVEASGSIGLVRIASPCDGEGWFWASPAAWRGVLTEIYLSVSDCSFVTNAPPCAQKGEGLARRGDSLRGNLIRPTGRLNWEDRELVVRFYDQLTRPTDCHWFWLSVAESLDDPRKISYAPDKSVCDNDARRRKIGIARFLKGPARKIGGACWRDEDADRLAFLVGQHFPGSNDYSFEIVRGLDGIREVYDYEKWGSCMFQEPHVDWYGENPAKVAAVKILLGGAFVGRALLWTTDSGARVLDRVYPSDEGPHIPAIHKWAEGQGIPYKTVQGCVDGHLSDRREDYTVSMRPSRSGSYPYCDTFKYTEDDPSSSLRIVLTTTSGNGVVFNDIGGSYQGGAARLRCCGCGYNLNEDDSRFDPDGNALCDDCYGEQYAYLDYQLPSGRWVEGDFGVEDVATCDHCGASRHVVDFGEVACGDGCQVWCLLCIHSDAYKCPGCRIVVSDAIDCTECSEEGEEEAPGAEPVPAIAPPPAREFVYTEHPLQYHFECPCDDCREITRRRENAFPSSPPDETCFCFECTTIRHFRRCWLEARYPNVLEAEAIARQRAAGEGLATAAPLSLFEQEMLV